MDATYIGDGNLKGASLKVTRPFTLYNVDKSKDTCLTGLNFSIELGPSTPHIRALSVSVLLTSHATTVLESPWVAELRPNMDKGKSRENKRLSLKPLTSERFFSPPFLPPSFLSFDPLSPSYAKRLKLEVSGEKTNKILWSIVIKDPSLNLPSDLPFAMLIHHGVPFQAEISVSARMGGGIRSALKESPGTWVIEFDGRTTIGNVGLGKGKAKEEVEGAPSSLATGEQKEGADRGIIGEPTSLLSTT